MFSPCFQAAAINNEDLRCGEEIVTDAIETQKDQTLFANRIIVHS